MASMIRRGCRERRIKGLKRRAEKTWIRKKRGCFDERRKVKIDFIHEPELQFGTDKHIDIKFGLMNYGPLDFDSELAPRQINLGLIGTPETIAGVEEWLGRCQ